ncbi:MAG: glycosyltransferase family 4 protein [Patescibacteria group bacterium]|nr:MAG: glycosyltransferase family 4 protein [Patescibacteria group bacterium]
MPNIRGDSNKIQGDSSIERLRELRVALVHDDLIQLGGAEKVFMAIAEMFPDAPIYTSMATRKWRRRLEGRELATSFMQRLPLKEKLFKFYFLLYPIAFESFDLSGYDLVISSSTRFAHGVITKPGTTHICYMHSPGRMFWEPRDYFNPSGLGISTRRVWGGGTSRLGSLLSPALSYLRLWDRTAAQRVDYFIANSRNIAGKIKKYYGREAAVVHPFVDLERFASRSANSEQRTANREGYFLVVTRLAPWKRVGIAVEAVMQADARLKVVGGGPDEKRLKTLAGSQESGARSKIEILGNVSDEELAELYQNCKALIMTQEEDFGITSLEAQALGKPVIAYGAGGALETVVKGKTGEFFSPQTGEVLAEVLKGFKSKEYSPKTCRSNAEKFSIEIFKEGLLREISKIVG